MDGWMVDMLLYIYTHRYACAADLFIEVAFKENIVVGQYD